MARLSVKTCPEEIDNCDTEDFKKPNSSLKLVRSFCAFEILTRIYQSSQKLGHCAFKKSFSKRNEASGWSLRFLCLLRF